MRDREPEYRLSRTQLLKRTDNEAQGLGRFGKRCTVLHKRLPRPGNNQADAQRRGGRLLIVAQLGTAGKFETDPDEFGVNRVEVGSRRCDWTILEQIIRLVGIGSHAGFPGRTGERGMPLRHFSGRFQHLMRAHDHPEGPFVTSHVGMVLLRFFAEGPVNLLGRGIATDAQNGSRIQREMVVHTRTTRLG